MHREMAHHVLAAPLQEYLRCEGQSWWGGSNELLLRGVIMRAGGTVQELGLPIGLMRDTYCPTTAHGGCHAIEGHLMQCSAERLCKTLQSHTRVGSNGAMTV